MVFFRITKFSRLYIRLTPRLSKRPGGAANRNGQITLHPFANSGLQALAPRYIIFRPGGDKARGGLVPDIPLPCDPVHPDAMVDQFPAGIRGASGRSR